MPWGSCQDDEASTCAGSAKKGGCAGAADNALAAGLTRSGRFDLPVDARAGGAKRSLHGWARA